MRASEESYVYTRNTRATRCLGSGLYDLLFQISVGGFLMFTKRTRPSEFVAYVGRRSPLCVCGGGGLCQIH